MALARSLLSVGVAFAVAFHVNATKTSHTVTPVQKVIELLTKLDTQLAADAKREAEQYDKYACFCKEQADNKLYAIERSEKKEAELTETIKDLAADIKVLNSDIGKLSVKITALGKKIKTKTDARKIEHDKWVLADKEVSEAIDAVERAIEALKASKGELQGHVEMEALVQLKQVATLALGVSASSNAGLTKSQWNTLSQLTKAGEPGDAYDYKYHSNDIIATLESLRLTFIKEKNDLYDSEFEAKTLFDKAVLDLSNEKTFAEADKLEKEKIEAYKTELKEKAVDDLAVEKAAREADERFMDVLKGDCQDKATLWDQRSQVRADELKAISEALDTLKTGVVPNWKANRKLNGLQVGASGSSPTSFLQLRGSARREAQVRKNVVALLQGSAGRLHSSVLAIAALKVEAAEDHFVKVRSMIKDIIETLEQQKKAEATTKSWCDKQMKDAVTTRDEEQAKIEDNKAQIAQNEADKAQLEGEIAELSEDIANLQKALLEATELRADEKKDNLMVIGESGVGKEAVEYALEVLQQFYESVAFAQVNYVPPDSDREGATVGDLAPEVFDAKYKGAQASSKGIIGMLNVILSDFERTGDVVSGNEKAAASQFVIYKKKTELDIKAKEKDKDRKEGEVRDIEDELVRLADNLRTATDAHQSALKELETLSSTCVEGEETYEERIAKRQKEIEALKEAQSILENWQN